jgi:hypothetical protein
MIVVRLHAFMVLPAIFIRLFCVVAAIIFVVPAYAWSGEFRLVPSVKVQEKYDDNIWYSADESKESDFISTITPGVEFKIEDPRLAASLKASLAGISYVDNTELNAVDQFLAAGLSYMFTQRLRSQVNLKFTQDSQRDRDIEETGLPILSTSARERLQYDVAGNYTFSEKTSLNLSYGFSKDRYENTALTGFQSHAFGLGLNHDLSQYVPELVGMLNFSTMRYDYPSVDVQNTSITMGASWQYSEKVNLSGGIGPRFSNTKFEVPVTLFGFPTGRLRTEIIEGQGIDGSVSCTYQGLFTRGVLSLSRNLDQASGRSGATERTATGLNISRRLTEEISVGFKSSYYVNKSDQRELATQGINTRTWQVQPRINCQVSHNLALQASYGYWSINENPGDVKRTKNMVFLELRYEYPFFE